MINPTPPREKTTYPTILMLLGAQENLEIAIEIPPSSKSSNSSSKLVSILWVVPGEVVSWIN
jgi:hypothetical protein